MSQIHTLCYLLEGMLPLIKEDSRTPDFVETVFLFCAMWAFGGALNSEKTADYRKYFSQAWRSEIKKITFPEKGYIFDYFINMETGDVVPWADNVEEYVSMGDTTFANIVV